MLDFDALHGRTIVRAGQRSACGVSSPRKQLAGKGAAPQLSFSGGPSGAAGARGPHRSARRPCAAKRGSRVSRALDSEDRTPPTFEEVGRFFYDRLLCSTTLRTRRATSRSSRKDLDSATTDAGEGNGGEVAAGVMGIRCADAAARSLRPRPLWPTFAVTARGLHGGCEVTIPSLTPAGRFPAWRSRPAPQPRRDARAATGRTPTSHTENQAESSGTDQNSRATLRDAENRVTVLILALSLG
jgi:hypothetical protein